MDEILRDTFLPYALPSIGEEEISEVVDSLRSGWVTTGPKVKRFEEDFAAYVGCKHAIAVNSCTAGLHIALTALGIGPGDEVVVPTLTFCSTANVVIHLGARPVLVDVGEDCNVTAAAIEAAITPQTGAIIPVHYGGQACNLDEIYALAERHGLPVVEDAAHAIGSIYRGQKVGSDTLRPSGPRSPRITVFSFYATKNMTTGEGGMITTAQEELAKRMRVLTLHGMSRDAWKRYTAAGSWYYEVVQPGYKNNMTDIQAALGLHQLRRLDNFIKTRQDYARLYDKAFGALQELETPVTYPDRNHIYHLYPVRLKLDCLDTNRGQFIEMLRVHNIGASVHFIPVHLHPFYQDCFGYQRGDFPNAEAIYDGLVSLPLYPKMTHYDVEYVIRTTVNIINNNRRSP